MDVVLRPSVPDDRAVLLEVYSASRQPELDQLPWSLEHKREFAELQFNAQDADYRQRFADASFDVITLEARVVGRLYVDRRPGEIRILDLAVLPGFRDRGIEEFVIRQLMKEADGAQVLLTAYIETYQPVLGVFEGLGFRIGERTELNVLVEYGAGGGE